MKFNHNNGIASEVPEVELAEDLDGMLQSAQVSSFALAEALVDRHFHKFLRLTSAVYADAPNPQEVFNLVVDGLSWAVHHRQTYWSGSGVTVWLYTRYLRRLRRTKPGRQWPKSTLRILLCDHIGLSPIEADAVLSNKIRAVPAGQISEDLAQTRLNYARHMLSDNEKARLLQAVGSPDLDRDSSQLFSIPPVEEVVRLVLETSAQAGVGRYLSRSLLQAGMLGGLLLALVGFVLYRTTIEQEISARVTPRKTIIHVTATPGPSLEASLASAPTQTDILLSDSWETVPGTLALEQLTGKIAEYYFIPENSGLLALAAVLDYWHTPADLPWLRSVLQPNSNDSVVMFYELVDFAESLGFTADFRLGGNVNALQGIIRAGFPVIAQIGYENGDFWDGQYVVVSGFEPEQGKLMVELLSLPTITTTMRSTGDMMRGEISFSDFEKRWFQFAGAFMVVYRPGSFSQAHFEEYQAALNSSGLADEASSYEMARQQAEARLGTVQGRSLFFVFFSYATALVYQRDYGTASTYYDAAFQQYDALYPSYRPYRTVWYQTRPYWAYYYSGNYSALINLADRILAESAGESTLEETYYWRALAKEGLGDLPGAIGDFEKALELNPNFTLAQDQLTRVRAR